MIRTLLASTLILLGFVFTIGTPQRSVKCTNHAYNEWIAAVLKEVQSVRVGMTRKDLLKAFRTEGGLSSRSSRKYVYKDCPYIKVDVIFQASQPTDTSSKESPDDKIVSISKPYLEYSISD